MASAAILMIHGIGGTSAAFDRLAPAFRDLGWRVETPTFRPELRTKDKPPEGITKLTLGDYIDDMAKIAAGLEKETGIAPVLLGHSLGGLVVQKLAERGVGRAAVLVTPASPADVMGKPSLAQAVTFGNVLMASKPETKAHKIWLTGFRWGVLNRVPGDKHIGIFDGTVYDSGLIYQSVARPHEDPGKFATVDETKIRIPMLVLGAGKDRATPVEGVRGVAAKYARIGAKYLEYPDNAHWIVDEPGTDKVIADVSAWLAEVGATAQAPAPAPAKAAPEAAAQKAAAPKPAAPAKAAPKPKAAAKPAKAAAAAKAAPASKPAPPHAAKATAPQSAKPKPAKAAPAKPAPKAKAAAAPKPKAPAKPKAEPAAKAAPAPKAAKPAPKAKAAAKPPVKPKAAVKTPAKAAATPAAAKAPAKAAAKPKAAPKPKAAKAKPAAS